MTKYNTREVNLKSTAYNQDGQNYFQQLTIYNSMSAHLRRILLAKCVVDAGNRVYMRKKKQFCKPGCKARCAQTDFIDKLAYDTLHHPADFMRMNYDSKYCCPCEAEKRFSNNYDYDLTSRTKLRTRAIRPGPFKTSNTEHYSLNGKSTTRRPYTQSSTSSRKVFKPQDTRNVLKFQDRYEEISMSYESGSEFLSQDTNRLSPPVSTPASTPASTPVSKSSEDHEVEAATSADAKKLFDESNDSEYLKFVYEITHDIILNGLYTDEELHEVFNKHIEENREVLSMNRMLYEIYQLKIALNMTDEDEDEDLEDFVYSQQMLTMCKFRPPTPPRIMNTSGVLDKLKYQQVDEARRMSMAMHKAVVLVDANPQICVSERDVLTSLLDANISPEKAHEIFKRLTLLSDEEYSSFHSHTQIGKIEESNAENETELNNHVAFQKIREINDEEKNSLGNDAVTAQDDQNA